MTSLLGQPDRAVRLLAAAKALREVSGISLMHPRWAEYDHTDDGIRAQLDEATFAKMWAQGRAIPLE